MRWAFVVLASVASVTCAASFIALAAEASPRTGAGDASAPAVRELVEGGARVEGQDGGSDGGSVISRTPPDPPPLREREQWVFDLRWDRGEVYLVEVQKIDVGSVRTTPRAMGRFALELYQGPTLIERVRFDFPMLGSPEAPSDAGLKATPRFEPKLKTRIGVLFPATPLGTKLELWDRAEGRRWSLPWPPTPGSPAVDAGAAQTSSPQQAPSP